MPVVCVSVHAAKREDNDSTVRNFQEGERRKADLEGDSRNPEVARLSVKVLMATSPSSYIIHSQKTGHKLLVRADGSTERVV